MRGSAGEVVPSSSGGPIGPVMNLPYRGSQPPSQIMGDVVPYEEPTPRHQGGLHRRKSRQTSESPRTVLKPGQGRSLEPGP